MAPNSGSSNNDPPRGRFFTRRLRRASWISPVTGERSKRVFTLREASNRSSGNGNGSAITDANETTALLETDGNHHAVEESSPRSPDNWWDPIITKLHEGYAFAFSKTGLGIFKCSLAYLISSLATLIPAISALYGHQQNSKHIVCTVTVWFHPSRSIGSMHEATVLALIALAYSGFISFTSMGTSVLFANQDLLEVGHAVVLVVFVGGGLGAIAWVKQRLGHPLVNVACSLAALGCITILIQEGSVQAGQFNDDRVIQVLVMVLSGVVITMAVNLLFLPVTARSMLVKDMEKNTDLLGEMLISITRAFLSGRESDLTGDAFKKLGDEHRESLTKMSKDLGEAKREHLMLGKEKLYGAEARLVECLTGLSQDLGGLRSAAFAQFAFINHNTTIPDFTEDGGWNGPNKRPAAGQRLPSTLDVISETPESPLNLEQERDHSFFARTPERASSVDSTHNSMKTPNDMFVAFLTQLGPPTKSLVYTLKQILDELPFAKHTVLSQTDSAWQLWLGNTPGIKVAVNENFHSSLRQAVELYRHSRTEALETLHKNRAISAAEAGHPNKTKAFSGQKNGSHNKKQQPTDEEIVADIEEVSACCGHFSFSLLDFAEDVLTYLHILEQLKAQIEHPVRTWKWTTSWMHRSPKSKKQAKPGDPKPVLEPDPLPPQTDMEPAPLARVPTYIQRADSFARPSEPAPRPLTYRLYLLLRAFRRDDVLFAIKVGLGALLYALPAFLARTRPFFVHWRGEWGLVSYMAVCSMSIGASNSTSINRMIGTCIGAACAVAGWLIASDGEGNANPWTLGFVGWLMSLACFYLIIARDQAPMGRFILLTYNLGALYSYSLSIHDDDNGDDEGGVDPAIWSIVLHRLVAVLVGCIWAVVIIRVIWPLSARRKLADGLCMLWLRMGLVWKRDPLAVFLLGEPRSRYMDIREESSLQDYLEALQGLCKAAGGEYELRGPFPADAMNRVLDRTGRMLDAFHAMNVVIGKNSTCTAGEARVLRATREQRFELSARISHLFGVLASSMKMEFPMMSGDGMPKVEHTRDRLLAAIAEFRQSGKDQEGVVEGDYELVYAYVLVTGQLAGDIRAVAEEVEKLFGTLDEESLALQ